MFTRLYRIIYNRLIRIDKRILTAAGLIIVIALIFWTLYSPIIVGASATTRQLPDLLRQAGRKNGLADF